jgi:hypothetical protein
MEDFSSRIAYEEFWSAVGYWILVAGLIGDIIVLVVPQHRKWLEKGLAAFFTIVVIIGVAIEHRADAAISVLVSQEQDAVGLQISQLQKGNLQLQGKLTAATAELRSNEAALAKEQQETARAQKETAEAQLELRKYTETRWRNIIKGGGKAFAEELKGKPVSRFEILYAPEDEEAYTFGQLLQGMLVEAGWKPLDVRPLRESDALEGKWGDIPGAPLAVRAGAWYGLAVTSKTGFPNPPWEHDKESAAAALLVAITTLGGGQGVPDPRLPNDMIRIIIGKKP